ncbi:alpha/beta hydrolase [Deinococcus ruber]|uniref:Alpha/beta hydrolase n=1 Tax=Deinococcus ruber TaxID=1848197 RepID=A0A918FHZ9_9DEIO|nr:alpha/beta fold hydrolase [Deinococcus ruber]GGR38801.1 alpha/beta hydrolase [Deinococcus ruber]
MTAPQRIPILFIHGLWLHHSSWQPWLTLFKERGYDPVAPGWPHEPATVAEARLHPERVANQSLQSVVDHFKALAQALPARPILIGHSFGGLIVERLLGEDVGVAGVAIDPAQIRGVLPLPLAQLRAGLPALGNPANISRAISLTADEFRFGFGNALSPEESDDLFDRWTIPSPVRGLFEVAVANFNLHAASRVNTHNDTRGPLLLISGTADHTAPEVTTRAAFRLYRHSLAVTQISRFEGRGHSLVIDHGWREVAETILVWLDQQRSAGHLAGVTAAQ